MKAVENEENAGKGRMHRQLATPGQLVDGTRGGVASVRLRAQTLAPSASPTASGARKGERVAEESFSRMPHNGKERVKEIPERIEGNGEMWQGRRASLRMSTLERVSDVLARIHLEEKLEETYQSSWTGQGVIGRGEQEDTERKRARKGSRVQGENDSQFMTFASRISKTDFNI
ncbi:hypothetical protein M427DRAFT_33240 [Gonapodya prolifera JEL478]|uniref:Uncharacterized protein n=1 Tax=Gonapodya prolifera (strain JEL478) TaxID=1344416 RepID=A0A139ABY2_GONPJ|nr:hypothetical protein M427DRAFT_33240 [Gonapodya prolifera JEL478]|eukprot:KXS14311.1 hypothetical protein M427DRAFT_33240 [Gonapodya prolifera JEL478]